MAYKHKTSNLRLNAQENMSIHARFAKTFSLPDGSLDEPSNIPTSVVPRNSVEECSSQALIMRA
jgi:hypothetical protein